MPSKSGRERSLLIRFLTAYDHGDWNDPEADWVDERLDGAVEVVAKRKRDGATIAIEHTIIQPHPKEKEDFAKFTRAFEPANRDPSLERPDSYIYVDIPIGVLQKGEDWGAVVQDVCECIRANKDSLPEGRSQQRCVITAGSEIILQMRLIRDPGTKEPRTIIRRYGPFDLTATIRTALTTKLPKLVGTNATRRLLMFEREQWLLDPREIAKEVENQRADFPRLASVDEIWMAETHDDRRYALFEPVQPGRPYSPVYSFDGDVLLSAPGY